MLYINLILFISSLLNNLPRRSIINIAANNIIMKKPLQYYYNNNDNNNFIFDKNSNDESEIKTVIHSENNNLFFMGELNPETCFYLQQNLIKLQNKNNTNINFYIQSMGGTLLPTFSVIDTIRTSKIPVFTYVNGYAASSATLLSVSGHKKFITKNSMMLIHSLRTTIGEVNFNQLKDNYYNSENMMNIIKNIYKENTKISEEILNNLLLHDYWLNSTECLKYNLVDFII